jgi:hypothetical protein
MRDISGRRADGEWDTGGEKGRSSGRKEQE